MFAVHRRQTWSYWLFFHVTNVDHKYLQTVVAPGDTTQALTRCYRRFLRVGGFENIFFWIPTDSPDFLFQYRWKLTHLSDIIYSTLALVTIISACMYKLCRLRFCIWNGLLKHCMQIPGDLCFVSTGWITRRLTGDMCVQLILSL